VELNIDVPADLDQLGRDDSHGAIIGGEGLVQLGHDSTDGRRLFHQVDKKTRVCQIQGCLHAGNPSANYHHGTPDLL
jgi:hypothetical protein